MRDLRLTMVVYMTAKQEVEIPVFLNLRIADSG
jgi:hypothetical protein